MSQHLRRRVRWVVPAAHCDGIVMRCRAVQEIAERRRGWEWCHWVNPASLASIPSTWHAHILSRRQPRDAAPP